MSRGRRTLDYGDSQLSVSRTYRFDFAYPAERLWEVVSDTPRWGEALVFPRYQVSEQLLDYVNEGQEVDLWSMRPLALARRWQADTRATVELFLQAVRAGMLESRWDILCPRCRIGKSKVSNIAELPSGVHCAARLEGEAEAGGIAMSLNFTRDRAVGDILRDYRISSREARLKGFHEPLTICRIKPQANHE